MNAQQSLMLARRFIELPLEKRRLFLEGLREEGVDFSLLPIPAGVQAEDRDAPSYAQRRMWFLWQLEPQSGAYNLPCAVRLRGALDEAALQRAFADLVARHETLRTVFRQRADDSLYLAPLADAPLIEHEDLSALEVAAREARVREEAERQSWLPFDLQHGPLLRIRLLRLVDDEHVLLLTLHHIVADGWSMNLLIDELARLYDGHALGAAVELPALLIQYADYALWQRRWLEAGEQARQLDYWRAHLGDDHTPLALPTDRPRPAVASHRGTRHEFAVDAELAEGLRGLARAQGISLFMLLLGSFGILLQRYSGQADIRVGVPIANRTRSETEGLIGFFVNTQVLRLRLDQQLGMEAYLQRIREITLGAQDHQELPFERLVEAFDLQRSLSHNPLFQVMYNHQPQVADISALQTASGLTFSQIDWRSRTTQFDLTLDTYERGGKLHAALTYAEDLFDAASIERMARHWQNLLRGMLENPQASVDSLPMLDDGERHLLVEGWNATASDYPLQRGVHQLFEEQATRTPTAPALAFGEERLDYAALNRQANRLAHALIERGVGPDSLVGVSMERSVEMVVALLAILKAGGAYVPVDPEYPIERQAYMLEDSGVKLLLSQSHLQLPLAEGVQRIDLDQADDWLHGYGEDNPGVELDGENLAYVIYTSGSTGKPKGAGNRHSALTNRLCWMQQAYALGAGDTVLQKTPFSFDVSVWEFFWPLMTGARLVVAAPGDHRDPAKLVETINRESITTLHFVPSMLQAFLQDENVASCSSLQRIVCSGEALPTDAQQQVFAKLPQAALYNLYGPTEAAIDVTHWTCVDEGKDAVPIGKPIANLACYILDGNLEPVPVGVLGELYLAGQGLARGYHQRLALTAERFVASPFVAGERLYRSGDLARYRADGVIEYAGRIDHQVKLRGLRIELGEIEARLLEHPQVREAAVLAVDGKQLVGYVVLAEESQGWRETLATHLAASLPEYMVPAQWLALERMPLSANGKLERKALPRPDASMAQQEYVAPQNEIEQRLAAIWQDVLGRERIGRDDNFFELGGDSIVSIQVVSRARQAGIRFTPKDLFRYQTVRSLAAVAEVGDDAPLEQGAVVGEVALTPVQHGFFEQDIARREHWNQSLLLEPRAPLQATQVEAAIARLIEQHDALRLRFTASAQGWQQVHASLPLPAPFWHCQAANGEALAAICDEAQRSLNLAEGPLLRAVLVDMADGSQRLLLAIHHLVVDGVSWRILLEDLQALLSEADIALPAKTSAYQAWSVRLQAFAHDPSLASELDYWRQTLADAPSDLPCDNPEGSLRNAQAEKITLTLDGESTRQLLQDAPGAYRTQVGDLLLTALARAVTRWSGADSALVQLEGHGREELFAGIDLTRTVGWFTSLFPVRLTPGSDLPGSIKTIKEQLRAVPSKGLGFGVLRYLGAAEVQAELAALAQPRITFNYLGQFDGQFDQRALFVPASESPGRAQDEQAPLANWLSIEGQVYGGELSLHWTFSREMFAEATVQRLVEDYRRELAALIEHCCISSNRGLTPSDFPLSGLDQTQLDELSLDPASVQDIYPLSPMQQGMLFHTLYEQAAADYINQLRVDVQGLDVERFKAAWEAAVAAHDSLRSAFVWQALDAPLQVVQRQVTVPFTLHDWRGQALQAQALDTLAEAERSQPFELSQAPLLRLVLVRTGEQSHHLIYTHHHILMDGWSNAQLLGEVLQRYSGQPPQVQAGAYRDYIAWLQKRDSVASEAFWRAQLAELDEPTRLAQALRCQTHETAGHGEHIQILDQQQTQRLSAFARAQKVTLNTLLQAAWLLLLQRYTGQQTVAFGATVAGRPVELRGVEQQLGLFINTLPVIATPRPDMRVGDWLQAVQAQNLALREHEQTPLYEIQRWAGHGGEALFDSILVFENYPVSQALEQGAGETLRFGALSNVEQTNYPLTLGVSLDERLSLQYVYARRYFVKSNIANLNRHLLSLLQHMIEAPQAVLGELALLDAGESQDALRDWQVPLEALPQGGIAAAFARQVTAAPEAIALVCGDESLSYAELDVRAERLARGLHSRGVGAETLVAIVAERGFDLVVGLLGILKAGAGYLPLDPNYPTERLEYMLRDSGARWLLCPASLAERLDGLASVERLPLEDSAWPMSADTWPLPEVAGETLAYLIYTSGSSGQPKGVAVSQAALVGHCLAAADTYGIGADDCLLHFASISFDAAAEQLFVPLLAGARVLLGDAGQWSAQRLAGEVARHAVTVLDLPPAYLQQQAEELLHAERRIAVRACILGGEAWNASLLAQQALQAETWFNAYGPTEAVITPLAWHCRPQEGGDLAIGRAIGSRRACILDAALQPCAPGMVGELYIGGHCLARGYLGRPSQTAERFVVDPFSASGERLYRTGDLARYRADGLIEYLGRIDQQIKIRGFRIETGEIESQLLAHSDVAAAAVVALDSTGGLQLAAYIVPRDGVEGGALLAELRAMLAGRLPTYMQPAVWQLLPSLPRNANGKLDRKALAQMNAAACRQVGEPPRDGLERSVATIWEALLGVEGITRDEHFFELGGHSLSATRVISRLRQELGLDVPLRSLFEQPTLAAFCSALEGLERQSAPSLRLLPRGGELPLSYAQQRMWFLWQLDPQSAAYHLPSVLRVHGLLDLAALQGAFDWLVQRHESLRTRFVTVDGQVVQQVLPELSLRLMVQDCASLDDDALHQQVAEAIRQPFDLASGPLMRVCLLNRSRDETVLVIVLHHIVSDGWSMQVMVDELLQAYAALSRGEQPGLAPLVLHYADYAAWQRAWLEDGEGERQLAYWRQQLGSQHPVLALPTDHPRPAQASGRGQRLELALPSALSEALQVSARREGITPFMFLLASFQLLLQRYSDQSDIRVGVPIANRNHAGTERLIGLFVNTQVLRCEIDGRQDVRRLLRQVREAALGAQAHQDLPFEQLVDALQPERSLSHNPLFQVLYNHQSDERQAAQVDGLRIDNFPWDGAAAQFDLVLDTWESPAGLGGALTYAEDLFDAASIERMARHWQNLLRGMLENPQASVDSLPMLDDGERHLLVEGWNATASDYPLQRGVHQLFEEQAARTPTAPALAFGEERLDYAALNRQANRLAHALIERGVGPDSLVGVSMERSVEMVVALLAILKAGGAYVPVDPEYPIERQAYMLEDSGVKLLLSQSHLQLPLAEGVQRIDLDQAGDWLHGYAEDNPGVELDGENLAYVIYTSGSTGKPKGAGNRHSALTNRLCWMQQAYGLGAGDTVLQKTPFSFDVSVWEFFWPLMTGARLVVAAPGDHRDPAKLVETINRESVTTLHFVPSMLQAFLQDENVASCSSLQRIVCSGEALPTDAQQQVFAKLPQAALYNLYGPTEAAIDVTHWTCVDEGKDAVPIGKPIANLACYILDGNLEPVPVGVLGELYLAGQGLARGYHQRPALTAERFVASPFVAGERLYRSGDLARYRADGVIEYAGRIDHQVKLRGLRIELGEIEARLLEHPQVREAAVLAVDGKQLVGYVVLAEESQGWRETLATHLAASLPEYMVPAQWLGLERMPLSANGKLERKELPPPDASMAQHEYVAPQGEMERRIAAIWAQVLQLEEVGATDNFFALGGDSIVSIQVVSRARQAGIQFTPKELFQHQTVQSLARVARECTALQVDQGPVLGETALLPFQRLFFEQPIPNRQHWNQSLLLKPREVLDGEALGAALRALVGHHDALRLRFYEEDGTWRAEHAAVDAGEGLLWRTKAADGEALEALCEEAQRSLNLAEGPLLRALLVEMADGSQRLLLVIHHLVVDGVSWRILLEDLQSAYQQRLTGQAPRLPAKTDAFKTWAARLGEYAKGTKLAAELDYWREQLDGASADLPCCDPQASLEIRHTQSVRTRLNAELTRRLLQEAPMAYRTQVNDLLLTALARVICRWSGEASVLVQMEGHGREELFADIDLSRTVGWFTSLFPVRLTPAAELGESLKAIKEQLRAIPGKGLGYGLLRHLSGADNARELAALPQARVTFNYLGQFDGQFDDSALLLPCQQHGGAEVDPQAPLDNWLSLNGRVFEGRLSIDWTFSSQMFDEADVRRLAEDYVAELSTLVTHCCDASRHGATPSDFPLAGLDQSRLDALPVALEAVEDIYPLSPMQQGMLFHSLYEQGSGSYINQMRVDVSGLDIPRFRAAWQAALERHAVLRSAFVWQGELQQPLQIVYRQRQVPFAEEDLSQRQDRQAALEALAVRERQRGFQLQQAPLLRLLLVRTGENEHQLIYTHHHILLDGWSNAQLLSEVLETYGGRLPQPATGQYRDYIAWLQRQDNAASEAFWREQLAGLDEPTRLVEAQARPESGAASGIAEHLQQLDTASTARLRDFAQLHQVTLNTLVQAAWALLLQRYTGHDSVVFGATVSGRPAELQGIEQQIGLFINTLPVVVTLTPQMSLAELLHGLQRQNLALREQEHTPLFELQRWAGFAGEALFDNLLVFENYPVDEVLEQSSSDGVRFASVRLHEQSNYPLALALGGTEQLSLQFSYDRGLFPVASIERLGRHLTTLLEACVEHPQRRLVDLQMLEKAELSAIAATWQRSDSGYAATPLIHQRVAEQARLTPDAVAVIFDEQKLSYAELDSRANRLAHALIARGVGPEVRVAIAMQRSAEIMVAFLAVLKAGGAYVPLDIEYPRERLLYMMQDSRAHLLLTHSHLLERLPLPQGLASLAVDREQEWASYPADEPQVALDGDNLAYVIYTSGSTGMPKGVAVSHGPLVAHIQATGERYEMTADDCELHFMSFAFDGSHEGWMHPLINGARVLIRDDSLWLPERTYAEMHRHGVTVGVFPPVYLQQLAEHAERDGNPPPVRVYCFGGDAVAQASYDLAWRALKPKYLFNGYGPTETVVTPLLWKARQGDACGAAYMPIGTLLGNRSGHILDAQLNLLPVGVAGELYLGGEGVARGYLERPALTAERFVPDPFGAPGSRLYRSGDLTRGRADGVVDYLGRVDHQVKIRGFRIELGEIEARLREHPVVREAVVVAQPGAVGQQLVGYVVAQQALDSAEAQAQCRALLKTALRERLPEYMVPAHLLFLQQMPLTPNGKLDRKGLPQPDASQLQQVYVAPSSELEQQIAAIWAEVLQLQQVGLNDNFFELGGHSLLAIQVTARVQSEIGMELPLAALFQTDSLQAYAELAAEQTAVNDGDFDDLCQFMNELEAI